MADPVLKKITTLTQIDLVAAADVMPIVDISEANASLQNKKIRADQMKIFLASQMGADVIETAAIKDNVVTEAKLGTIKRTVTVRITSVEDEVEVTNYGNFYPWPITLNNFTVIDARINLATASSSGSVTVALSNQGGTMATLTLTSGNTGMANSGTIAASYKTAITNNFLSINVTGAGTGAKGLTVTLVLEGVPA